MNGTAIRSYCFVRAAVLAAFAPALAGCFYEEYEVISDPIGGGECAKFGELDPIACKQNKPTAIAADNTHVYWTNEGEGKIMAMSKADGAVATLVIGEDRPCGIVASKQDASDYIYWRTRGGDLKKMSATSPDAAPELLKSKLGDSCLIGADFGRLFYFRRPAAMVHELVRLGIQGDEVVIATTQRPNALSVGTDRIGFIDGVEKKAYLIAQLSASTKQPLSLNEPCGIGLQAAFGVVTSMSRGEVAAFQIFMGAPMQGVTISNQPTPCLVATTKDGSYWLSDGEGSLMFKALALQSSPELIATGPPHACAITTDDTNVYWTTCDPEGMIFRAPR